MAMSSQQLAVQKTRNAYIFGESKLSFPYAGFFTICVKADGSYTEHSYRLSDIYAFGYSREHKVMRLYVADFEVEFTGIEEADVKTYQQQIAEAINAA